MRQQQRALKGFPGRLQIYTDMDIEYMWQNRKVKRTNYKGRCKKLTDKVRHELTNYETLLWFIRSKHRHNRKLQDTMIQQLYLEIARIIHDVYTDKRVQLGILIYLDEKNLLPNYKDPH